MISRIWKNRKRLGAAVALAAAVLLAAGCGGRAALSPEEADVKTLLDGSYVTDVEERTIVIPELTQTYHFLFLSDMHIVVVNDELTDGDRDLVQNRFQEFSLNGHSSAERFAYMMERADAAHLDGVLLGGDIIDFLSAGNAEALNASLQKLQTPYLYVTADHDMCVWWTQHSAEEERALQQTLDFAPVDVRDYGEFLIVGVSNNTSCLTEEALAHLKEAFAQGKPVILVQHVPLDSLLEEGLRQKSQEVWQGRSLLWGQDGIYEPDAVTQEFLDMVYAPDSPVVAVLAGHLHFRYETALNEQITEFIFNPAYAGEVAYITVTGEASAE